MYENIYEYTLHYSYERIGALLNCPEFNENNLTNADIDYHQLNTSPEKKQQLLEIINFLYGTEKLLLTHKTQHTKASDRNTIQQTNAQKLVLSTRLEIYKLLLNTDENNQESTWLDHIDTLQQTTTDVISHFMQELIEEKRKNLPSRDKKLSENPLLSSENKNKPIVTQHRSRSTSTKKKKKNTSHFREELTVETNPYLVQLKTYLDESPLTEETVIQITVCINNQGRETDISQTLSFINNILNDNHKTYTQSARLALLVLQYKLHCTHYLEKGSKDSLKKSDSVGKRNTQNTEYSKCSLCSTVQ
ncbi:MAG: hypothetical protein LRY69_04040 [Gammaproteobacteria bacterium]|nr:hypothetical protein [Gammaproteobacteria bacterium]